MKVPRPPPPFTLAPCPPERAFRFSDGVVARSLDEFAARLDEASPATVSYHREHFAPWVREVVGDAPLARRIEAYAAPSPAPDVLRELLLGLVRRRLDELRAAPA